MLNVNEQNKALFLRIAAFVILPIIAVAYFMKTQATHDAGVLTHACSQQMAIDAKFMAQMEQYMAEKKAAVAAYHNQVDSVTK